MPRSQTIELNSSSQHTSHLIKRWILLPFEAVNTLYAFLLFWLLMVAAVPIAWVSSLFHPDHPKTGWSIIAQTVFRWYVYAAGVRLVIENAQHLPKEPRYAVFAANHTSLVDGLLWGAVYQHRIFALTLPPAKIPWPLNFWLVRSGSIPVARTEEEHRRYPDLVWGPRAVSAAVKKLTQRKKSLLIFPEGHVERIHRVQRFHTGAVRIALQAGVPLIPMTIRGADRVFSPNNFILWPGTITFRLHQPLDLTPYYGQQHNKALVRQLTERVRRAILRDLPDYYQKIVLDEEAV